MSRSTTIVALFLASMPAIGILPRALHASALADLEQEQRLGSITGQVVDRDTEAPLAGATVTLIGTTHRATTDANGRYSIPAVPVGAYTLQFVLLGYRPLLQADVIVRSQRTTAADAGLAMVVLELEGLVVTGAYFPRNDEQPTSVTSFSSEEVRRAPGSAGDVSRIMMVLPSVAKINDLSNNLVVRGGSPTENTFYIDNIEVPNINHYPTQGASGGPIGLVNVDFIRDVEFSAGGFGAAYGDRLSSIMNMTFRDGNRQEFDGQLDLSFAGFGAVAEGPLGTDRASWLLSARRSFLDLLLKMGGDVGTVIAPEYSDYQGKVVYDLGSNHRVSVLGILGIDHLGFDREAALENDQIVYGTTDIAEGTGGINWRALWGGVGVSNTSLSFSGTRYDDTFTETLTERELIRNRSFEREIRLRNVNHWRPGIRHQMTFGVEAKYLFPDYDTRFADYTDALGAPVPALTFGTPDPSAKVGAFVSWSFRPVARLTATLGLRADYFSLNRQASVSPRAALSYALTNRTTLTASTGIYRQSLPLFLLAQSPDHVDLEDPMAVHYVLGAEHMLTDDTRLTVEAYYKDYRHFPRDPTQPSFFVIDELFYRYGFFFNHAQLLDDGRAYSSGVEAMVQKRLAERVYGLVSAAYFRTRYEDASGTWRDRVFDNRVLFSVEGGYKPGASWEFSLRWIYAGGAPYTPFDAAASAALNRAVLDGNRINGARYPDYHSLNLRLDRRFHFSGSNLIAYVSVWNAYNRSNVAGYYWNEIRNQQETVFQWNLLPIFGLEYEF